MTEFRSVRSLLACIVVGLGLVALATTPTVARQEPAPAETSATAAIEDGPASLDARLDFQPFDETLTALIERLLERNPEILAARARSHAIRERVAQESALPSPELRYRYFVETPETRVGPQRQSVELMQGLPWFGKQALNGERAAHMATGQAWNAQELERALVAELKKLYFDAAYYQEALAINAEETELLQRFEQIAITRYSTGEGNQQSVIKVQTDITRLRDQATGWTTRLRTLERRMARLVGDPQRTISLAPIELYWPDLAPEREALERESVERNPATFAAESQMEADRTWIRSRSQGSKPDFAVGVGLVDVRNRRDAAAAVLPPADNGKDSWSIMLQVKIPIYGSRNRAGVTEAELGLEATGYTLRATQNRLRQSMQEALLELDSLGERGELYREVLIPQARESLASAEASYTTNRLTFLDLLDAERILFLARRTHHRLLADYWVAVADVERLVARPFPGSSDAESDSGMVARGETR